MVHIYILVFTIMPSMFLTKNIWIYCKDILIWGYYRYLNLENILNIYSLIIHIYKFCFCVTTLSLII